MMFERLLKTHWIRLGSVLLSTLLTVGLPLSAFTQSLQCSAVFTEGSEVRLKGLARLEKNAGHQLQVIQRSSDYDIAEEIRIIDPKTRSVIGSVDVYHTIKPGEGTKIEIGLMKTTSNWLNKGVAEALLEQILLQYPGTVSITTGKLTQTNHQVVIEGLAKGLSVEQAIRLTPAYKIRARFGYTEIVPGSINEGFGFQVRKQ